MIVRLHIMCLLVSAREGRESEGEREAGGREREREMKTILCCFSVTGVTTVSGKVSSQFAKVLVRFSHQPCILPPLLALSSYWLWWWLQIGRDSISSWISPSSPCGSLDGGKVQICCYFLSFISRPYQPAFSSACLASVVQGLGSVCAVAAPNILSLHTAPLFLFSAFSNSTWTSTFCSAFIQVLVKRQIQNEVVGFT